MRGGRQDLRQKRHALHGPHGDVERPCDIHGHGGSDGYLVSDIHVCCGGDVDGGQVDRAGDGDGVLQVDRGRDVHRVGGDVHLSSDCDGIVDADAAVHGRGDGGRVGDWCRTG